MEFKEIFPETSEGIIELMSGMLKYNPGLRFSAHECLKSKIFDKIRVPVFERGAPHEIKLQIYDKGQYDYEEC